MTSPVALKCPSCASPLRADDMNLVQGIATCSYCRAVMTFPAGSGSEEIRHERPPVPLPSRVTARPTMHGTEIVRRWFTPVAFFLVVFCIIWDGFLVIWYSNAFATGGHWLGFLFPVIHLAAGVFITYTTVATFVNSTRIALERGEVKVRNGPLPWPGNITLHSHSLDQLYCKEKINRHKNGVSYTYQVWAALKDGTHKKLVAAGLKQEQAIYIEQEMERALGIKDRWVSGEMLR